MPPPLTYNCSPGTWTDRYYLPDAPPCQESLAAWVCMVFIILALKGMGHTGAIILMSRRRASEAARTPNPNKKKRHRFPISPFLDAIVTVATIVMIFGTFAGVTSSVDKSVYPFWGIIIPLHAVSGYFFTRKLLGVHQRTFMLNAAQTFFWDVHVLMALSLVLAIPIAIVPFVYSSQGTGFALMSYSTFLHWFLGLWLVCGFLQYTCLSRVCRNIAALITQPHIMAGGAGNNMNVLARKLRRSQRAFEIGGFFAETIVLLVALEIIPVYWWVALFSPLNTALENAVPVTLMFRRRHVARSPPTSSNNTAIAVRVNDSNPAVVVDESNSNNNRS